jgi:hypothetical protein
MIAADGGSSREKWKRALIGFGSFFFVPLFFTWTIGSLYPALSLIFVAPALVLFLFTGVATRGSKEAKGCLILPTVILAGCIAGMIGAAIVAY